MNERNRRITSLQIRASTDHSGKNNGSRPSSFSGCSTDIVDFTGGRNQHVMQINSQLKRLGLEEHSKPMHDASKDGTQEPKDHFIELVLATKESTSGVGWLISDGVIEKEVNIPFYGNVTEGGNFDEADWKDQPVVRQAQVKWKENSEIAWMERHMEMTQGFILIGKNPGMMILGEPTHDREDLPENERDFPDISRMKGYIFPPGYGIIIKKGTWHDFPVSVGPDVTVFILNTREVVDALVSMKEPGPMDFGDCYKIRSSDSFHDFTLRYPDPRPMVRTLGLLPSDYSEKLSTNDATSSKTNAYGEGMIRTEIPPSWAGNDCDSVWVVPVVNVEAFSQNEFGPSIQPHLNKTHPEIANKGWRDYGQKQGLGRLGNLFKQHNIACTAVVSSDLAQDNVVMNQLHKLKNDNGWEIGAHGTNNSTGGHAGLSVVQEKSSISNCIKSLEAAFGSNQIESWLTPGFSVTSSTPNLLLDAGINTLLDFVDDDSPTLLRADKDATPDQALVCLPYSMEVNDFSLILTRHLSPQEYATALESHIMQLAKESRELGSPKVVCLGMHTFVAGSPAVVHELNAMLMRLRQKTNIKWATAEQVSTNVRQGKDVSFTPCAMPPPPTSIPAFEAQEAIQNVIVQNESNIHTCVIPAEPAPVQVNRNNLGLILIDIQNDFMSHDGFGEKLGNDTTKLQRIIAPTKNVLHSARSAGLTIIHTREGHRSNLADLTKLKASGSSIGISNGKGRSLVRGEWGAEFVDELAPLENDSETVIEKSGKGSFYQTDLDLVLRNASIDTLIVCGVTTEVCVHSTVRDATDRGIKCIVLKDCTASYFDEFHEVGIKMISSQNGIFGSVSDSKSFIDAISK